MAVDGCGMGDVFDRCWRTFGTADWLARAYQQHLGAAQIVKQLPRQAHGGSRHADAVLAYLGVAAHLFGDAKGALKQLVQDRAHGTCVFSRAHRAFELTQNLRFAQHHRIQPRRHAKNMARSLISHFDIGMALQFSGRYAAAVRHPVQPLGDFDAFARAINLGAVAGRNNRRFSRLAESTAQIVQG